MSSKVLLLIFLMIVATTHSQRSNRVFPDQGERASVPGRDKKWKDVGVFPFPRGETPVFHFDQGDEGFINTIPELITGLDKIRGILNQQTKITTAFGEAFDQCEACG